MLGVAALELFLIWGTLVRQVRGLLPCMLGARISKTTGRRPRWKRFPSSARITNRAESSAGLDSK